jgi:outer membrane PBP1 activator LpoA protein
VANAFADEWQKLGGGVVLQQKFGSVSELRAASTAAAGIALNGSPVTASLPQQQGVTIGGLTIPAPPTDAQISGGGKVDAAYIVATPEEIAFIKPMIAMRNGSQSGATLYASSRSAQGTAGPDFRLEMEGLQYSEIPMLAGSNPALMQQALSACVTTTLWRVCMRWVLMPGRWRTTLPRCVRCRASSLTATPAI